MHGPLCCGETRRCPGFESPRENFFGHQPFRALTSCGGSGWDDSAGGGRRCLVILRGVAPPPGLAMQGAGQTAPRRPARHRLGRDARALAESRSCLRGRSGRCYPVPRGTKCMHHRSAPLRWRGVAVPLVAARQRRDDHTRVGCTPVPELRNDRVCMDREGRTAQRLALVEGLGCRQGPAERVLLLDLVYTHEPIFTGKHLVERSELGRC